jgi:hypothetical protein
MKIFTFLLLATILTSSCNDHKCLDTNANACSLLPWVINEVPWIIELKKTVKTGSCGNDGQCETSLLQGTYNGQVVIFISVGGALCDALNVPTLYNCEGKIIKSFTTSAEDIKELFDNKLTRDRELYSCKN